MSTGEFLPYESAGLNTLYTMEGGAIEPQFDDLLFMHRKMQSQPEHYKRHG